MANSFLAFEEELTLWNSSKEQKFIAGHDAELNTCA